MNRTNIVVIPIKCSGVVIARNTTGLTEEPCYILSVIEHEINSLNLLAEVGFWQRADNIDVIDSVSVTGNGVRFCLKFDQSILMSSFQKDM